MNFDDPHTTSDHRTGLRAGDAEREQAADALRRHHAEGRLTDAEFEQRVGRAYAARTIGELDRLFADLPRDRRGLPEARGSRELLRGVHPLGLVVAAFVALWVLSAAFATVGPWGWHGGPHPFFVPLILAFVVWRLVVRRGRRRRSAF